MGQRAYCDLYHPGGDAEAERWCEMYHRPVTPKARDRSKDGLLGKLA